MIIRRKMAIKDYAKVFDLLDLQHVTTIQGDKLASFTNFKVGLFGEGFKHSYIENRSGPSMEPWDTPQVILPVVRIEQIAFCLWVDSYSWMVLSLPL